MQNALLIGINSACFLQQQDFRAGFLKILKAGFQNATCPLRDDQAVRKYFLELCGCSCFQTILEVFLFNRKKIKETCISAGRSLSNDFLYTSGKTIGFLMGFFLPLWFSRNYRKPYMDLQEEILCVFRRKRHKLLNSTLILSVLIAVQSDPVLTLQIRRK